MAAAVLVGLYDNEDKGQQNYNRNVMAELATETI